MGLATEGRIYSKVDDESDENLSWHMDCFYGQNQRLQSVVERRVAVVMTTQSLPRGVSSP